MASGRGERGNRLVRWLRRLARRRPGPAAVDPPAPVPDASDCATDLSKDEVSLSLPGLCIVLRRQTTIDVPAEVTVVVPRAEIRCRSAANDAQVRETEIIYSSITVVHAPRAPLAGPPPTGPRINLSTDPEQRNEPP
ncbi:MAG: hypothetical protein MJA84_09900 [Firmicutes bacterium]|nr:hypothetical protein [Bacillota bacterium]